MTTPDASRPAPIRPAAVTMSAMIAIVGSLLLVLLATSLLRTAEGIDDQLPGGHALVLAMVATLLLAAVAGITTAVGLLRVRHWARLAILILGGSLVACCTASALVVLAMPLGEIVGANAARAGTVRNVMLAVYAVPGAIGAWWLVYFTREPTKALFAADGPITPPDLPLSVALIAWACVIGGVLFLALPFLDTPVLVGSAMVTGWSARAVYLALALVQLFVGRGLLRLDERAHRAGVWFFGLGTLYGVAGIALPGMRAAAIAYGRTQAERFASPVALDVGAVWWWISALVVLGFALPWWALVRWRRS